jgi:hypothetical protein
VIIAVAAAVALLFVRRKQAADEQKANEAMFGTT